MFALDTGKKPSMIEEGKVSIRESRVGTVAVSERTDVKERKLGAEKWETRLFTSPWVRVPVVLPGNCPDLVLEIS